MLEIFRTFTFAAADAAFHLAAGAHWLAAAAVAPAMRRVIRPASPRSRGKLPMAPARSLGPRQADLAGAHIGKAASVVQSSIGRAERASGLHEQAATKLDAAEYALNRLMDELSAVMTTPVSLSGWDHSAPQATTARNSGLALAA